MSYRAKYADIYARYSDSVVIKGILCIIKLAGKKAMGGIAIMIRIKLHVSDARYHEIEQELTAKGFVIDEDADLILTEKDMFADHLIVRSDMDNERVRLSTDDIIIVESFGHDIVIHTHQGSYKTGERLYQLERLLDPSKFLRISHSVIVAMNKIQKIKPTLSSKFILTMINGQIVDVTRSYYGIFKDRLGF